MSPDAVSALSSHLEACRLVPAKPAEIARKPAPRVTTRVVQETEVTGKSRSKRLAKHNAMRELRRVVRRKRYVITSVTYEDRKDLRKWVCHIKFTY